MRGWRPVTAPWNNAKQLRVSMWCAKPRVTDEEARRALMTLAIADQATVTLKTSTGFYAEYLSALCDGVPLIEYQEAQFISLAVVSAPAVVEFQPPEYAKHFEIQWKIKRCG